MIQYDTIFSQIQYDTIFSQKISEQKIFSKDFRTNEIQYYNTADYSQRNGPPENIER